MDPSLKQRLVGALVITALAAIFLPMLLDDPVDQSRQEVQKDNLEIPPAPREIVNEDNPIPQNPQEVLHGSGEDTSALAADESGAADDEVLSDERNGQELLEDEGQKPATLETAGDNQESATLEAVDETPAATVNKSSESKMAAEVKPKTAPVPVKKPKAPLAPTVQPIKEKPQRTAQTPLKKSTQTTQSAKNPQLQRWVVQLGSFSKKDNADALVNKLRTQGFNAYGDAIPVQGKGTLYRVRIGPELDKKRALATQSKVRQMNALSSILITE